MSMKREFYQNLPSLSSHRGAWARLKDLLVDEQAGTFLDEVAQPVRLIHVRHEGPYIDVNRADLPGVQFSLNSERVLQSVPVVSGECQITVDPGRSRIELVEWVNGQPAPGRPTRTQRRIPHRESKLETKPDLLDMLVGLSRRAQLMTTVIYFFLAIGYVWGVCNDNTILAARTAGLFIGWLGTGGIIRWLEIG
jgi:hypothetical protein